MGQRTRLAAAAAAGLILAGALGALASDVTSRPIGISGEPVSVEQDLVAPNGKSGREQSQPRTRRKSDTKPAQPAPTPATPSPPPVSQPPVAPEDVSPAQPPEVEDSPEPAEDDQVEEEQEDDDD